ncbi:MAG: type II secretion system protein [Verrucomicrobiota bacterium]
MKRAVRCAGPAGISIPELLILLAMVGMLLGLAYPGWQKSREQRRERDMPVAREGRSAGT